MPAIKKKNEVILCPMCGGRMKKGKSIIRGTFGSFLWFGFSYQCLWFNKEKVIVPNMVARAFRCYRCKITLIKDN